MPIPGYLGDPTASVDEVNQTVPTEPASRTAASRVLMTGGTTGSPTDLILREGGRQLNNAAVALGLQDAPRTLTPEDANAHYGIEGELHFDKPVSEDEAAWRHDAKRDEVWRRDVLQRSPYGALSSLGLSFVGGNIDPASFALNFVPIAKLGEVGVMAESATRGGQILRGMAGGALTMGAFSTVNAGVTYGLAHLREGRDYSLSDAAAEIGSGVLFGTVMGAGHGAVRPLHVAPTVPAGSDLATRIRILGEYNGRGGKSPKGAAGSMQLMPETARDMAARLGLHDIAALPTAELQARLIADPELATRLGTEKVAQLRRLYGDDEVLISAAYNAGEGRVNDWLKKYGDPRTGAISHEDWAAAIPFKETRNYVQRVTGGHAGGGGGVSTGDGAQAGGDGSSSLPPADLAPMPREVAQLDPVAQEGALAHAIDRLANDEPVQMEALFEHERTVNYGEQPHLDDGAEGARPLAGDRYHDSTAVTTRGTEIPVSYQIAELRDLITSHDDDLVRNPFYPDALQPRARERAGNIATLMRLEKEFNPKLLMDSAGAETGAPIVAPDGVVESGNGRAIVLRRLAREGGEKWAGYKAQLESQGYDTKGFDHPVLVRRRTAAMSGQQRVALAREMNASVTAPMSVTEQASQDAAQLSHDDMALYQGGAPELAQNRAFVRRFVDQVAAGDENTLVDGQTRGLTKDGARRIEAAIVAKAYGDRDLVYALYETNEPNIISLGRALAHAAPEWSVMRGLAGRGEIAAWADVTDNLVSAAAMVRSARDRGIDLGAWVADLRDGADMFEGSLSRDTQHFLSVFFKDPALKRPRAWADVSAMLKEYATAAGDTAPGPDLLGESHALDAGQILDHLVAKWRDARPGDALADLEDLSDLGNRAPELSRIVEPGVRDPGQAAGQFERGPGSPDQPAAAAPGGEAGGQGQGGKGPAEGVKPPSRAEQLIAADPELKALQDDIASLRAEAGEHADADPATDPNDTDALGEAMYAAMVCLDGELS